MRPLPALVLCLLLLLPAAGAPPAGATPATEPAPSGLFAAGLLRVADDVRLFHLSAVNRRVVYLAPEPASGRVRLYSVSVEGGPPLRLDALAGGEPDIADFALGAGGRFAVFRVPAADGSGDALYRVLSIGGPVARINAGVPQPYVLQYSGVDDFAVFIASPGPGQAAGARLYSWRTPEEPLELVSSGLSPGAGATWFMPSRGSASRLSFFVFDPAASSCRGYNDVELGSKRAARTDAAWFSPAQADPLQCGRQFKRGEQTAAHYAYGRAVGSPQLFGLTHFDRGEYTVVPGEYIVLPQNGRIYSYNQCVPVDDQGCFWDQVDVGGSIEGGYTGMSGVIAPRGQGGIFFSAAEHASGETHIFGGGLGLGSITQRLTQANGAVPLGREFYLSEELSPVVLFSRGDTYYRYRWQGQGPVEEVVGGGVAETAAFRDNAAIVAGERFIYRAAAPGGGYRLVAAPLDGPGPSGLLSPGVPVVAGPPLPGDELSPVFAALVDGEGEVRKVVFRGAETPGGPRSLYVADVAPLASAVYLPQLQR